VLADRATGAPADSTTPPDRTDTEYLIITPPAPPALDSLKVLVDSIPRDTLHRDSVSVSPPPPPR
jgi:hypothetical protein